MTLNDLEGVMTVIFRSTEFGSFGSNNVKVVKDKLTLSATKI